MNSSTPVPMLDSTPRPVRTTRLSDDAISSTFPVRAGRHLLPSSRIGDVAADAPKIRHPLEIGLVDDDGSNSVPATPGSRWRAASRAVLLLEQALVRDFVLLLKDVADDFLQSSRNSSQRC